MGDGHSHAGGHAHGGRGANRKRLMLTLGLVVAYMIAEVIGGLLTNSLALLADAGHMLSDAGALALSLFAIWIAQRPATSTRTYGFHRTEILAALANGGTLVAVSIYIFIEAWQRFRSPPEVAGGMMMVVAVGGLVVNLLGLWILNAGRSDSLNVRGAWLHVLTDALGSVGAIVGGFLIWAFGWEWADPAVSVLIGILVIGSSWHLLKETVNILMEGAPPGVDVDGVRTFLDEMRGIHAVHDLHVWSITSGMISLSAHAVVDGERHGDELLRELRRELHDRFGIDHITIQLETEGCEHHAVHA